MKTNKTAWQPMSSAPKDGTPILVTETPNGEHWNVMPACWMAQGAENITPNDEHGRWWGISPAYWGGSEGPLPARWKPLAITPVCWMPFPKRENKKTLWKRYERT